MPLKNTPCQEGWCDKAQAITKAVEVGIEHAAIAGVGKRCVLLRAKTLPEGGRAAD